MASGQCVRLRIKRFGFEPWPGTLCCVLGQDTLTLTVLLSTQGCKWVSGCKWVLANLMLGGNPAMD